MIRIEISNGTVSLCQVNGENISPSIEEILTKATGVNIVSFNKILCAYRNGRHKEICVKELIRDLYTENRLKSYIAEALESINDFKESVPEIAVFEWEV